MHFLNSIIVVVASALLFFSASAAPTPQYLAGLLNPVLSLLSGNSGSQSSPNPIGDQYPLGITGTINATMAVIPIPYSLARSIIPAHWGILTNSYQSLLPGFPTDKYPLFIRAGLDHDTGVFGLGVTIPDFQAVRIQYPFVDLLGDGYSSFAYEDHLILSSSNVIGTTTTTAYGTVALGATFQPDLQAYDYVSPATNPRSIYLSAQSAGVLGLLGLGGPLANLVFTPTPGSMGPYPIDFYVNVTNQAIFGNGLLCGHQTNFWNTSISTGVNAPVGIQGTITLNSPAFPTTTTFTGVQGIKVDLPFFEDTTAGACSAFKG